MAEKEIDIHGFKVKYDDSSHTLNKAVEHLTEKLEKSEAEVYFNDARRDRTHHTAHFEVRDHERNKDHDLTLTHHSSDGSFRLQKRSQHNPTFWNE